MKYVYAFLLLVLIIPLQLQAQRNFKPGYIIGLKGDTTKGFVDYRKWKQNPQVISFEIGGITQQYSYLNIKGFGVNNLENYEIYTGPISRASVKVGDRGTGIDSSFTTGTVFLRSIFKGKNIALHAYRDKVKTRFFIAEKNGVPIELKRYVYLDKKRAGKIIEDNLFRQQLLELAIKYQPGNSKLADQIHKLVYRADDITTVVLAIDGSGNQLKIKSGSRSGIALFAGLSANYFKTAVAGNDEFLSESKPSRSILPGVNLGLDMYFNKNTGKLIFRTEVGLSANNVRLTRVSDPTDNTSNYLREDKLSFNQLTVTIMPQLIYNVVNKSNFKAYLSGGAQINLAKYNKFNRQSQVYQNNVLLGDVSRTDPDLTTVYNGAIFKVGCVLNNTLELYAGCSTRAYIQRNDAGGLSFNVDSYRIGINYRFGKSNNYN